MIVLPTRLAAGLLAATTALSLSGAVVAIAPAQAAAPAVQVGLFGSQDPTYDGAFRQSLGLLAFLAAGQTPPAESVTWLLDQQCADGGFQAFREDTSLACVASDHTTYSGPDTNSTGLAAAALVALGRTAQATRARTWLLSTQRPDGGFPYYAGGDSDANSTASVLVATNNAGLAPSAITNGTFSAVDYVTGLQVGCAGAAGGEDGGFAYQDYGTGLVANDIASAQATFALTGAKLPLAAGAVSSPVPRASCPAPTSPSDITVTAGGAGYLARLLEAYDGAVPQFDYTSGTRSKGTVSPGDTAWAALSLTAVGVGSTQVAAALGVLATATVPTKAAAARSSAGNPATDVPGVLALAALAAAAGGGSADSVDALVDRIGATTRLAATPTATPTPSASPSTSGSATPTASLTPTGSGTPEVIDDSGLLPPSGAGRGTAALGLAGLALLLLGALAVVQSRRGVHRA